MKNWNSYIDNNEQFVLLPESEILINYGKEIDSINRKVAIYTNNHINNSINENVNDIVFNTNERKAAAQLFTYIVTEYKKSLEHDLQCLTEDLLYFESLNDDEYITEGIFSKISDFTKGVYTYAKEKVHKGKEFVIKTAENIKVKLEAVSKILKAIAKGVIKTVKDIFNTLLDILDKVGGMFANLLEKCGINTGKLEKLWVDGAEELAKSPDEVIKKIKTEKCYESIGNSLNKNERIVLENYNLVSDIFESEGEKTTDSKTVKQGEAKGVKSALWQAFLGLGRWFVVCVAIPGVVIGFFPGTFLALLVPLACKLAWNCYSIVKLWRQFKKVKKDWPSMKTWQKWLNVITMIATLIGICFNFKTIAESAGPVLDAFAKSGFKLMAQAKLGIEPDILQKGFGAIVKMLKEGKLSFDDLAQSYKEIGESFAKEVKIETVVTKIQPGQGLKGGMSDDNLQHAKDFLKEKMQGVKASKFTQNMADRFDDLQKGLPAGYKYFADNIKFPGGVDKVLSTPEGQDFLKKFGDQFTRIPFKSANKYGTTWCALYAFKEGTDGTEAMAALKELMHNVSGNGVVQELGTVAAEVATTTTTITQTLEILSTMAITIPSVTVNVQNDSGFRVRLGGKNSGKYVYEVGKDGVKEEMFSKDRKQHYQALIDQNDKYKKQVENDNNIDKDKKETALKRCEEFDKKYKKAVSEEKYIILHGKLVDKGKEEEKKESYVSLYDYIINEELTKKPKDGSNKSGEGDLTKDNDSNKSNNDIILVFSPLNIYGFDIAKSANNGPRKPTYNFKGLYNSLEFIQIEGGLNSSQITELLGNILTDLVNKHLDCVIDKPCDEKYKINKKSGFAPDEERPDFGMLTNKEICDILNKKADFEKIFNAKGGKVSAAETPDEKKELKKDMKAALDKLNDEGLQQKIKNTEVLKSKYVNSDGTIKYHDLAKACAERKMAKRKSKGLWTKIKSFFGFGKNDDYTKALDNLNDRIYESYNMIKPNIKEYMYNNNYIHISLSEYCKK